MSLAALADGPGAAEPTAQACAHCGERLPSAAGRFCCSGCAAAFRLIEELGLARYYAGRQLDRTSRLPRPPAEPAADWAGRTERQTDGAMSLHLMVDGLHCAACVWLI